MTVLLFNINFNPKTRFRLYSGLILKLNETAYTLISLVHCNSHIILHEVGWIVVKLNIVTGNYMYIVDCSLFSVEI